MNSDYSNVRIRDCIIKIPDLIDTAIKLGHSVVALTDHDCVSGHVKAIKYYKKIKEQNPDFKLILGNEIYLCRDGLSPETYKIGDRYWHFILLAKDEIGHHQMRLLSTRAWMRSYFSRGLKRVPTYYQDLKDIIQNNKGHIIALNGCLGGYLDSKILEYLKSENEEIKENIYQWIKDIQDIFGKENFYLELQPPAERNNEQDIVNKYLLQLSKELNIKWVCTTDSHYSLKSDRLVHKAYLNSQDGEREVDSFYATTYQMSTEEIESYFDFPLDEAYQNILEIKNKCVDYELEKPLLIPKLIWKKFNPVSKLESWIDKIPLMEKFINSDYIGDRELAKAIIERIESDSTLLNQRTYEAIEDNLDKIWKSSIVNKAHWSAYLLNLQNIIDCCWEADSLVMPARGSCAGFILVYLLGITQINPLRERIRLYSWRFLNPSRVSPLDIDCDIQGQKRSAVLAKFREVYGEDKVCNVITFGTEKSKSAILTGGRGIKLDVDLTQYISSLIPSDRGVVRTLSQCYYGDKENGMKPIPAFVQIMKEYPELWQVAQKIEGLIN